MRYLFVYLKQINNIIKLFILYLKINILSISMNFIIKDIKLI